MRAHHAGQPMKPETMEEFESSLTDPIPGITREDSDRRIEEESESWGAFAGMMGSSDA